MSVYQAVSLMILFGMFTISLLSIIVSLNRDDKKGKKQSPCLAHGAIV
jgi:hypothetical protein